MTEDMAGRITEPKALRALAHPTRWAIIELLGLEDTATATRCAEYTGESVASCSYHLAMLAKYGFVEQAEGGTGREKPWRGLRKRQSWGTEGLDDEGQLAAETLTDVFLDHTVGSMKAYQRRASRELPGWHEATVSAASTVHLTLDELTQLTEDLNALANRFRDRIEDRSLRPEGARPVRMLLSTWLPVPPPETGKD